jgi:nucleoid-associated protein YgaU
MSDRITERFEPQEPAPTYDWDFDSERRPGPKVLWGRVVALAALLIIAFAFGRATAGGGVSQEDLDSANERITNLEAENDDLREQLAAQTAPATSPSPDATPDETTPEGETYKVRRGDNLRSIAEDFYGDVALDDCIARANDISDPTQLSIGMELIIPPEEDC